MQEIPGLCPLEVLTPVLLAVIIVLVKYTSLPVLGVSTLNGCPTTPASSNHYTLSVTMTMSGWATTMSKQAMTKLDNYFT